MAKYQLTINEKQLEALVKSTEAFSRICTGQLMYALEEGWTDKLYGNLPSDQKDMIEAKLKAVTLILSEGQFDGYSGSYGIYNPDISPHAATSYNILQVLRNQRFKDRGDNKESMFTVDSSVTICNGEEPVKIEKIED
jgi:arginyl-tRNA--protein-N-Asp/Glu arginylyltransferase